MDQLEHVMLLISRGGIVISRALNVRPIARDTQVVLVTCEDPCIYYVIRTGHLYIMNPYVLSLINYLVLSLRITLCFSQSHVRLVLQVTWW